MDVTIIVVSHNTRDMTIACLRSVIAQTQEVSYELIVFDNGSQDGSVDAIRSEFPQFTLITSARDLGFASANNAAAKNARGTRLLLLNPDTIVLAGAIDRLYRFAEANPASRIWGGRTVFADGSLNPSCWRYQTLLRLLAETLGLTALLPSLFQGQSYGAWKGDTTRDVDVIAGCFFLIDRDLWDLLNGFDPIYFMFGEEADLCLRARKLGAHPKFTPEAAIIHYGGGAYPDRAELYVQTFASRLTMMYRNWGWVSQIIGRVLFWILPLNRYWIYTLLNLIRPGCYREKVALWHQVWRLRRHWMDGWTESAVRAVRSSGIVKETHSFEGNTV